MLAVIPRGTQDIRTNVPRGTQNANVKAKTMEKRQVKKRHKIIRGQGGGHG